MNDILNTIKEDLICLKENSQSIFFTIGTTSANNRNYLTPIRRYGDSVILGVVLSDINSLEIFLTNIEEFVDYFFVDIEKKLNPDLGANGEIQSNNFFHAAKQILPERTIYPFMPNDITVQSVWNQLVKDVIDLKNCVVFILGFGNIGSKVALRLAESGCRVIVKSRTDDYSIYHTVEALNRIKHTGAIGEISVTNSIEKGLLISDIVVFAANSNNVLGKEYTKVLENKRRVVGVARNNIEQIDLKMLSNYLSIDVGIELYYMLKSMVFQFERKLNQGILKDSFTYVGQGLSSDTSIVYDYSEKIYVGAEIINGKYKRLSARELYELD